MWISSKKSTQLENSIKTQKESFCKGLFLSARWFVLSQVVSKGLNLIVLANKEEAEYCASDLYKLVEGDRVYFLPISGKNIERSNYKSSLVVQRTSAISKIIDYKFDDFLIVVTYPEALQEKLPHRDNIEKSSIKITKNTEISYEELKTKLFNNGFEKVDFVSSPGQFAIRGAIIDIFSYTDNMPYRLSFFGDEVEKINSFDINTQLSVNELDSVDIWSNIIDNDNEYYITNLLHKDSLIWLDSSDNYRDAEFYSTLSDFKKVFIDTPLSYKNIETIDFNISPQPVFNKNFELLASDIRTKLESSYTVYIYGEKESQLDRLHSILSQNNSVIPILKPNHNIHRGFIDNDEKICCYSDHEIFDRYHRVSIRKSVEKSEQLTLNDISAFNIGDYIVHIDHGVGVFGGLVRIKDDKGRIKEMVKLIYKDNDVVFVSVHSLHRIARYKSKDAIAPKIHKLGSKLWQNLKNNTKSKVKDIAKELIQIYAKRKSMSGFAFSPDNYLQEELESSFIYEDTYDQEQATIAIKKDMEDQSPMDRLVCGDVGFGKTELAIRAAFKAVNDNKQVIVLVPTTILALQHYKTFTSRLKDFPCNIDYVSRLRTTKEVTEIKTKIKQGSIDILIGTHKLLSKSFVFKDLALLIIDEEQKFGVSAKEKIREYQQNIDTLTLTATPIPRTLQFSLLGARDLSIISTPPPNRIPIQTEIMLFDESEIKSIINYELNRAGQLFFLHNRVEQLSSIRDILQRLVPDLRICVAHGQMEAKVLENKMLDFMNGDYDLLLSTTIIESGIDIPNANTIIINQAQNFGLSDLHQLRGRVGRSNKKAFCYLIVPPMTSLSDDAKKRLRAIEEFSDLGSGFNIAMQDLDIRGAGNLLGAEQSGFISDMGYETYQKILAEAMNELGIEENVVTKAKATTYIDDCTIDTDKEALIPDTYINISSEKIRIYKELDAFNREEDIDKYVLKIQDRFGKMPNEFVELINVIKIRNIAVHLGFEKIIIKNGILIAFFVLNPMSAYYKSDVFSKLLEKVSNYPQIFELKQNDNKLRLISRNVKSIKDAYNLIKKLVY